VSELPPGWIATTLGTVAALLGGSTPKGVLTAAPGSIPFYKVADMNASDGYLMADARVTVTEETAAALSLRICPPGTVIFPKVGGALHTNKKRVLTRIAAFDTNTMAAVPTLAIEARLLYYWLSGIKLSDYAYGSPVPQVSRSRLSDERLLLPPMAEQRRIVVAIEEQFSRLDAAFAALERVRQNLKRIRLAAFTRITESVDAWRPLGEIAEVVGGVTKDAKRQSDPSFVEVPYLRVANVQRGYLDLTAVTTIRVPAPTLDKLRLEPGDILFNEGGDRDKLGRGWIWEGQVKDCIHQNHVFRARLSTDGFEPKFVSMHGNTFGREWFERMGKQTTNLASLNLTALKSFPVPDLPVERQREIVAELERQLSVLDSLQSVVDNSVRRCSLLRSSILATAFSGQLVPQDVNEEPASALLEWATANRMSPNGHKRTRGPKLPRETITT
jgi:type I restriction enzyme, S subunit